MVTEDFSLALRPYLWWWYYDKGTAFKTYLKFSWYKYRLIGPWDGTITSLKNMPVEKILGDVIFRGYKLVLFKTGCGKASFWKCDSDMLADMLSLLEQWDKKGLKWIYHCLITKISQSQINLPKAPVVHTRCCMQIPGERQVVEMTWKYSVIASARLEAAGDEHQPWVSRVWCGTGSAGSGAEPPCLSRSFGKHFGWERSPDNYSLYSCFHISTEVAAVSLWQNLP